MENMVTKLPLCKQSKSLFPNLNPEINKNRARYIIVNRSKWMNGTVINYVFIEGEELQKAVVRTSFQTWKNIGIGISFKEVSKIEESMIRIGFDYGDESWSKIGREALNVAIAKRTMNFGWDLTTPHGMSTALHEIGHAIGFQHEHLSPFSGIEWNVDAVYNEFSGYPNYWEVTDIDFNILNKLPVSEVNGSVWDPLSIMGYEFGPGLINKPLAYQNGITPQGTLSALDIQGVKSTYPPMAVNSEIRLAIQKTAPVSAVSGKQHFFVFTAPFTRKYTFKTVGTMDTVMIVSEKGKFENHYMAGDDDSGLRKNATISLPLVKGRKYLVNLYVMYAPDKEVLGITVS